MPRVSSGFKEMYSDADLHGKLNEQPSGGGGTKPFQSLKDLVDEFKRPKTAMEVAQAVTGIGPPRKQIFDTLKELADVLKKDNKQVSSQRLVNKFANKNASKQASKQKNEQSHKEVIK